MTSLERNRLVLENQDEAPTELNCVHHFSYSDQTEQNKMASHSQMGGSRESHFHPAGWIFLQWSDNEAAQSWKGYDCAQCRRLYTQNLGQRNKPPQLISRLCQYDCSIIPASDIAK